MNKFITLLAASTFAFATTNALATDPPKDTTAAKKAETPLQKPKDVSAEAWAKMSDADKAKAAEKANAKTAAAPAKKEKKGGC